MTVIRWDREDPRPVVEAAKREFEKNRPVVLPTDTLYGLAAPISNRGALAAMFELKRRPGGMTLPVAVGALHQLDALVRIHRWQKSNLRNNMPGPVTFVMEAVEALPNEVTREGTVAVRVPRHPIFLEITMDCGPLALTSANLHGEENSSRARDIDELFDRELLVIEDDGKVKGQASAVVDITERTPRVLREGKVNIEEPMGDEHG